MNTVFLASYFALWLLVLLLVFAFGVLARQIGLLHTRIAPQGARMTNMGPEIGEAVPPTTVRDIAGRQVVFGGPNPLPSLLVFMSPGCSSCSQLLPALRALWKNERDRLNIVAIAITGDEKTNRLFIADYHLYDIPYLVSPELGQTYKIFSPPYGLLLDKQGVVKAKGIANHAEHLESLLNAAEFQEPSVESYVRKRMAEFSPEPVLQVSSGKTLGKI